MPISKVTQVVDAKGKLKTNKCPKCKQNAMYFNFHNALVCRNCSYMPSCPTCKRHYLMEDIFVGENGIEYMKRPDGYQNTKGELSYLIGQLAGVLGCDGHPTHCKSKEEMVHDLDAFLKSYNDSRHLEIHRYTDKKESKEDIQRTIKWRKEKIDELKRNAEYHKNWHKDRIKAVQEEIQKLEEACKNAPEVKE